tara:strand:- start:678 stop:932 length:255 start_codon:yes stop_codon:yes gene_type:complete
MKLSEFYLDRELTDALPPAGMAPATPPPTVPGQTQNVATDPQAQAKMMAQQAVDMQNKKKELQDQIKAKQQEIMDLQKQLASIK